MRPKAGPTLQPYCDTCDLIGPREARGETMAAFVEVHRAWHTLVRELIYPWLIPAAYWIARQLDRTKAKP